MPAESNFTDRDASASFSESSIPKTDALFELVRHLARITADHDYNLILNSSDNGYSVGPEKGPRP